MKYIANLSATYGHCKLSLLLFNLFHMNIMGTADIQMNEGVIIAVVIAI